MQDNPFMENLAAVQRSVAAALLKAQRSAEEIRIIAVTKTVDATAVRPLMDAGLRDFGENRWQQARDKVLLPFAQSARWHFIGRLQANKVKYIVRHFEWVHSIDSLALAEEISQRANALGQNMMGLLQVNTSGEASKAGIHPEEVIPLLEATYHLPGLSIRGLMTMAPHYDDPELTRPTFATLRETLENARYQLGLESFRELSMGMSNDFGVAIEEGATMIRVGRLLMQDWHRPGED